MLSDAKNAHADNPVVNCNNFVFRIWGLESQDWQLACDFNVVTFAFLWQSRFTPTEKSFAIMSDNLFYLNDLLKDYDILT